MSYVLPEMALQFAMNFIKKVKLIMQNLKNKIAIVTAAASGIGAATSRELARRGAKVVVSDIHEENAQKVIEEIKSEGGEASFKFCDIGEEDSIAALISGTAETYGRLDVLHNNAALLDAKVFAEDVNILTISTEAWDKTMQVTLRGTMLGVKYAVKEMLKTGGGSIINTSSMYGVSAFYRQTAYGTAKAAINMLTQYVATSFGKNNIRVNAVAPSMIRTPIVTEVIPEELIQLNENSVLLPELGKPEDIAKIIAFLASDDFSYLTGQIMHADGGSTAHLATYADARRFYDGV